MFGFAVERSQHMCKQIGESLFVTYCLCLYFTLKLIQMISKTKIKIQQHMVLNVSTYNNDLFDLSLSFI